jgi:hypothetical protein
VDYINKTRNAKIVAEQKKNTAVATESRDIHREIRDLLRDNNNSIDVVSIA